MEAMPMYDITEMLKLHSLDLLMESMSQLKANGRTLTHYTDASTKKHVVDFNFQGTQIGKDNPFPPLVLPIEG